MLNPKASFETFLFEYLISSFKKVRFEKLQCFRLALFKKSTLEGIEKLNVVFENLKIGSAWLEIKINNGYDNKVTPSFVSEIFSVKKLNYENFVLKFESKKKKNVIRLLLIIYVCKRILTTNII